MVNNMEYLYGTFSDRQIEVNAKYMHNEIHKLLIYKDNDVTKKIFNSENDFLNYFNNLLFRFGGLNELLGEPDYMVSLMATLQAALDEVTSENYDFHKFRHLILDSHGYIKAMFEEV